MIRATAAIMMVVSTMAMKPLGAFSKRRRRRRLTSTSCSSELPSAEPYTRTGNGPVQRIPVYEDLHDHVVQDKDSYILSPNDREGVKYHKDNFEHLSSDDKLEVMKALLEFFVWFHVLLALLLTIKSRIVNDDTDAFIRRGLRDQLKDPKDMLQKHNFKSNMLVECEECENYCSLFSEEKSEKICPAIAAYDKAKLSYDKAKLNHLAAPKDKKAKKAFRKLRSAMVDAEYDLRDLGLEPKDYSFLQELKNFQ